MSSQLQARASLMLLFLLLPCSGRASQLTVPSLESVPALLLGDAISEAEEVLGRLPDSPDVLAFKGEVEFRKGRFADAARYYDRALDLDETTARAHFGLGKLAMGRARHAEAIAALSRAVELEPDFALYHLMLADAWAYDGDAREQARHLEAYVALEPTYDLDRLAQVEAVLEVIRDFGPEPIGVYELPEVTDPIPVSLALNLIFANVTIGARGPFRFILDTGASQTVLTDRLIEQLGLSPITSTRIYGIGGDGEAESGIYRVDELELGGVRIRNLPVGAISDPLLGQLADGIFSVSTFSGEIVSIDYPDSLIELNRDGETGGERLPVWLFSNIVFISVSVNGEFDGLFLLDTGAVTSILSHSTAAALGVTEDTVTGVDVGLVGISGLSGAALPVSGVTLSAGQSEVSFPLMVAIDLGAISKNLGFEIAGILGYDFLKDRRVSIDFANAEVTLSR